MVNPPAPPLKERARELVSDFQGAIQWTEQQPSTHEARDGYSWYACARSDLLNFIDEQIDNRESIEGQAQTAFRLFREEESRLTNLLASANARVAELEKEVLRLRILEALSELGSEIDPSNVAALPSPTEEPGK